MPTCHGPSSRLGFCLRRCVNGGVQRRSESVETSRSRASSGGQIAVDWSATFQIESSFWRITRYVVAEQMESFWPDETSFTRTGCTFGGLRIPIACMDTSTSS